MRDKGPEAGQSLERRHFLTKLMFKFRLCCMLPEAPTAGCLSFIQ